MITWVKVLASRIRAWFSIQRVDQDFNQELSSHLEMLTKENVQRGMPPDEAQREFGIRLALGSQPRRILKGVMVEGAVMAGAGIAVGAAGGFALARLAGSYFQVVQMPGAVVIVVSALVLLAAAVIASALPAARAARVDVIQALRAE